MKTVYTIQSAKTLWELKEVIDEAILTHGNASVEVDIAISNEGKVIGEINSEE